MKRMGIVATVVLVVLVFGQKVKLEQGRISPRLLNYQGFLTDTLGNPITNPAVAMTFGIYDALSGGNLKWSETQPSVSVSKGIFSVLLGSVTAIPDSVFNNPNRWLQLTVAGQILTPRTWIVSVPYAYTATYADTAVFARNGGGGTPGESNWSLRITDTADTALVTNGSWGLARQGSELLGAADSTHVNFGVACTTGMSGSNNKYCTVAGGNANTASGWAAGVLSGETNAAVGYQSVVAGGLADSARGDNAAVVGGSYNIAEGSWAFIGGGNSNEVYPYYGAIAGGYNNTINGSYSFIGSGFNNLADQNYTVIGGGRNNTVNAMYGAIAGGYNNAVSSNYGFVAGGMGNNVSASSGFAANQYSSVPTGYDGSAAFNGQTATAAGETRVGILAKASGTFTIDHPLDPENKILNHYFVESPEMVLIYRGTAVISGNGQATVHLPDYFDALNENPMIQLTGIGSADVYVVEKVRNNAFVIGGKPGTEVYWTVTGSRKDPSAQITKTLLPVEQSKTGALAGRSLDDEFLFATRPQLERMGHGQDFKFRQVSAANRYEEMKRQLEPDK